jgi:integrase
VESFHVALHQGNGKKGANANTIRARLSSLGFLGKYGARKRDDKGRPILPINPLDGYERPKRKRPAEKWLQPLELLAWLEVKRPPRISIVRDLLVDLGLRVSEMTNANWGDITEMHGVAYLSVVVKGGHPKRVPISPEVTAALQEWRLACNMPDPVEPILLNANGRRLDRGELSYITQKLGWDAGITRLKRVTPHTIRHTLNVVRRQSGIDSLTRSALLTHTSPSSIVSYEHLDPSELVAARAMQRRGLAAYLKSATTGRNELPEKL